MTNLNFSLITFCIVLLLLPNVNSLTGIQGSNIDVQHPVRVNGAIEAGTTCNISIMYPNQSILIDFKAMTEQPSYFNYTLNSTQTSLKGDYDYCITCKSPSGYNKTDCFDLLINLGGVEPNESRTSAISLVILLFFILSLAFFVAFLLSKQLVIKWSMLLFGAIFLLTAVNFTFISVQDEIVNVKIENFLSGFTAISFYIYWFLGALLGVLWLVSLIVTVAKRKELAKEKKYGL